MTEQMSTREKLVTGYLPYTLGSLFVVFALVSLSSSWAAVLAGGIIFLVWAFGISVFQLAILFLPGDDDGRARFHAHCIGITFASVFVAPIFLGMLAWLVALVFQLSN